MKFLLGCCLLAQCYAQAQHEMKPLFNGKNLDGWYSFLRTKGVDADPDSVFRVANGLLHISGKEFGYIATKNSFANFHLTVEFRWGEKKFPPREKEKRDNGILYLVPDNATNIIWPKGIECQIQEGDVGDFWLIDSATIWVDGRKTVPADYTRVIKKKDHEKPTGEWNVVEVIANNGKLTHLVNGELVNEGELREPARGRIMIQSEGAEIFFRSITLAELD